MKNANKQTFKITYSDFSVEYIYCKKQSVTAEALSNAAKNKLNVARIEEQ